MRKMMNANSQFNSSKKKEFREVAPKSIPLRDVSFVGGVVVVVIWHIIFFFFLRLMYAT